MNLQQWQQQSLVIHHHRLLLTPINRMRLGMLWDSGCKYKRARGPESINLVVLGALLAATRTEPEWPFATFSMVVTKRKLTSSTWRPIRIIRRVLLLLVVATIIILHRQDYAIDPCSWDDAETVDLYVATADPVICNKKLYGHNL